MRTLRIARLLLGVSAQDLARAADISTRELARIERGSVRPHPDTVDRLDAAFVNLFRARTRHAMGGT